MAGVLYLAPPSRIPHCLFKKLFSHLKITHLVGDKQPGSGRDGRGFAMIRSLLSAATSSRAACGMVARRGQAATTQPFQSVLADKNTGNFRYQSGDEYIAIIVTDGEYECPEIQAWYPLDPLDRCLYIRLFARGLRRIQRGPDTPE